MPNLRELTRTQLAQLALAVVTFLNVGMFILAQLDSGTLAEQQDRLFDLQRELRSPRGVNNPTLIQRDLDAAKQRVAENSLGFPERIDIIALHNHLVQTAAVNQVQLINLTLQGASLRTLAAGKYPVVDVLVEGKGELPDIQAFLDGVGKGAFSTTVLENLSLNQDKEAWTVKFDTVVFQTPS